MKTVNYNTKKTIKDVYKSVIKQNLRMKTTIIILLSLFSVALMAQPDAIETTVNTPPVATTTTAEGVNTPPVATTMTTEGVNLPPVNTGMLPTKSSQEVWLSLGVLVFGVIVVLTQAFLISKSPESLSNSFKYLSISLIIVGALFLVTAGYGNTQIASIIGLLGTVAGYLLGRAQSGPPPSKP